MIIEHFDGTRIVLVLGNRRLVVTEAAEPPGEGEAIVQYTDNLGSLAPETEHDPKRLRLRYPRPMYRSITG